MRLLIACILIALVVCSNCYVWDRPYTKPAQKFKSKASSDHSWTQFYKPKWMKDILDKLSTAWRGRFKSKQTGNEARTLESKVSPKWQHIPVAGGIGGATVDPKVLELTSVWPWFPNFSFFNTFKPTYRGKNSLSNRASQKKQ
ncbi:mitochondrial carrier [Acrasis kona]|uniref:Mitochondrial carrier n=1 Tax=Acrasis kona TaxID=1008807 RepID=A0AAW2YVJ4_9EUKA